MKNITVYLSIILLAVSIYYLYDRNKERKAGELTRLELMIAKDTIVKQMSKNGDVSFKLEQSEISRGNLKKAIELLGIEVKTLKDQDINWRSIVSILQGKLEASGYGSAALKDTTINVTRDTSQREKTFKWDGKYMTLSGITDKDSVRLKYNYLLNFRFITAKDGKNTIVTASFRDKDGNIDPSLVLKSAQNVVIKPRKPLIKWWMWVGGGGLIPSSQLTSTLSGFLIPPAGSGNLVRTCSDRSPKCLLT